MTPPITVPIPNGPLPLPWVAYLTFLATDAGTPAPLQVPLSGRIRREWYSFFSSLDTAGAAIPTLEPFTGANGMVSRPWVSFLGKVV